jgi:AcrR family transcriptional regulator
MRVKRLKTAKKMESRESHRPKRRRRTAEEARAAILAATEKRLIEGGPEALRLQEVAAEVGISHSTVLHHFGSREQLLDEFADHSLGLLQSDLLCIFQRNVPAPHESYEERVERTSELLENVSRVLNDRGYARLLAWLILANRELPDATHGLFEGIARIVAPHAVGSFDGESPRELDAATSGAMLAVVSLIGDAFFGQVARRGVGLPCDAKVEKPLHRWIAELIERPSVSSRAR